MQYFANPFRSLRMQCLVIQAADVKTLHPGEYLPSRARAELAQVLAACCPSCASRSKRLADALIDLEIERRIVKVNAMLAEMATIAGSES